MYRALTILSRYDLCRIGGKTLKYISPHAGKRQVVQLCHVQLQRGIKAPQLVSGKSIMAMCNQLRYYLFLCNSSDIQVIRSLIVDTK